MRKVLVLCHGNINRSPLCAQILKSSGEGKFEIKSAGFVNPGRKASKKMRDAAAELGYNLEYHRSQLITKELVEWADLVILMDGGNQKRYSDFCNCGESMKKVRALGLYASPPVTRIPDPAFIARGTPEFHDVVQLIYKATLNFIEKEKDNVN